MQLGMMPVEFYGAVHFWLAEQQHIHFQQSIDEDENDDDPESS